VTDIGKLVARAAAAQAALADAESGALAELVAAKDAHRANPTDKTRARKAAAVEAVQQLRAVQRAGRGEGPSVGGDAFVTTGSEG
jgi:hypothetical protein